MNTQLLKTRIKGRQSKPVQYTLLSSIILNSSAPPRPILPICRPPVWRHFAINVSPEAVCCHSGALTIRSIHCGWQNLTCSAAVRIVAADISGPTPLCAQCRDIMDWGGDSASGVRKDCVSVRRAVSVWFLGRHLILPKTCHLYKL